MTVVNYLWNPLNDNIVREFDDVGTVIAEYTTEANQFGNVVSQRRNGQNIVYHYDGQGSALALTNAAGDVTDTYAYSAFGEVTAHTGSTVNPFQYIGQKGYYWDVETNEYGVRRRLFCPRRSRWLSPDPLLLLRHKPLYIYCANRCVLTIDPSGLAHFAINVVDAAYKTDCGEMVLGGVTFDFYFFDEAGAPCDGYFVQKIDIVDERQDKCGACVPCPKGTPQNLPKAKPPFWEAWEIEKGQIHSTDGDIGGTHKHTDARAIEIAKGCGYRVSKGTVKFFCKRKQDVPANGDPVETKEIDWPRNNKDTESGNLPSTTEKPIWWDSKPADGPVSNSVATVWCCCEDAALCPAGKGRGSDSASNPTKGKQTN